MLLVPFESEPIDIIPRARSLGVEIDGSQEALLRAYLGILQEWNQKLNLTAITKPEKIVTRHFLDCLTLVPAITRLSTSPKPRVIDVGSGAGFPGIVVKIALPLVKLVLLEARAKKARFLEEVVRLLNLREVEVIAARAEEIATLTPHRENYDFVLSRAVGRLPTLAELTLPFCREGGYCIAQKKGDAGAEIDTAQKAISKLGGLLFETQRVVVPGIDDERYLIIIRKEHSTPPQYPRRPGIPQKRPIS